MMRIIVSDKIPLHGCPKLMYNGPCGGGSGNLCEVTRGKCVWVEEYLRNPRNNLFYDIILDKGFKITDYIPKERKTTTKFMRRLKEGKILLSYEYVVERRISPNKILDDLTRLKQVYDAVNFIDSPLGSPHIDPVALAILAKNTGLEAVVQVSCKDKSRVQLEVLILALMLHDLRNMLAITGDWPHLIGDRSNRPVFDLDAVRLVYLVRLMSDLGLDYRKRRIENPKVIHVGVAANPYFDPLKLEILRLRKKVLAGAEFVETQPVFDKVIVSRFIDEAVKEGVNEPLVFSVIALPNYKYARALEEFARIKIPQEYIELLRLKGSSANTEFIPKLVGEIISVKGVAGIHVLTLGDNDMGIKLGEELRRLI